MSVQTYKLNHRPRKRIFSRSCIRSDSLYYGTMMPIMAQLSILTVRNCNCNCKLSESKQAHCSLLILALLQVDVIDSNRLRTSGVVAIAVIDSRHMNPIMPTGCCHVSFCLNWADMMEPAHTSFRYSLRR